MTGIVSDTVDCPQCGLPAQKDDYYVVGDERVICNWCGYNHFKSANRMKANKGYGSIHYVSKTGNGSNQVVRLNMPMGIIRRHNTVMDIQQHYSISSSFFIWNDEEEKLECLLGELPPTLEEVYQVEDEKADYYGLFQATNDKSNIEEF